MPITAPGWLLLVAALTSTVAWAAEPPPSEQKVGPTAFNRPGPAPQQTWGVGAGRSYWIPAADIFMFDLLLNLYDRTFYEKPEEFQSNWSTFRENLTGNWVYDNDQFEVNQFGHPYQGSMYHGFARSTGHGYWTALGYTVAGSVLWELAGEVTPPSINDQFTTGLGGTLLGEPLFRLASLTLETTSGPTGFWREFSAALISPAVGFNRATHGRRFDGVFPSHDPAVYTRLQLGTNFDTQVRSDVNLADDPLQTVPQSYEEGETIADFTVSYGLPGKPGYRYERPFDYFSFQFTASSANILENVIVRGLLFGAPYAAGESYRGIWGLYGTYDYVAPQIFRVSNTGVALGTTGQWWVSPKVALQIEALAGGGYGSAGVIDGRGERDYHAGVTPQGMLSLRALFGDRALLELTARDYYVTGIASEEKDGSENIARGDVALSLRVYGLHGITLRYTTTHRDARYVQLDDTSQTVGVMSLGYTYLGHKWFGAVDWRPDARLKPLPE